MSYNFTFDLSKLPQALFKEIAEFSEKGKIHKKMGKGAKNLVKKFNVDKINGLPIGDSITVIEDLIDINVKNSINKERFQQSKKRALFLPHCCRKYMDATCKADFDSVTSSYLCNHCSKDCLVHKATELAKKKKYKTYILPGGSCVRKIFQKHPYTAIIGVACPEEIKLSINFLEKLNIPFQSIPLTKNGCSETHFDMETLEAIILG